MGGLAPQNPQASRKPSRVVRATMKRHATAQAGQGATLTVLAAAAEFERAVIVERTLDGLAAARRRGVKLGRPLKLRMPKYEKVAALRAKGATWPAIAKALRSNKSTVRYVLLAGRWKKGLHFGSGDFSTRRAVAMRGCKRSYLSQALLSLPL